MSDDWTVDERYSNDKRLGKTFTFGYNEAYFQNYQTLEEFTTSLKNNESNLFLFGMCVLFIIY